MKEREERRERAFIVSCIGRASEKASFVAKRRVSFVGCQADFFGIGEQVKHKSVGFAL